MGGEVGVTGGRNEDCRGARGLRFSPKLCYNIAPIVVIYDPPAVPHVRTHHAPLNEYSRGT